MPLLYPRLLTTASRAMFDDYRERSVSDLATVFAYRNDSAVFLATGGDRVAESQLEELRHEVLGAARDAGFPDKARTEAAAAFDRRVAIALRERMQLVPAEAGARDIWAFLALCVLPDVAFWRYPDPPEDRILGTDLTRHVFARLWWRAHLVHDGESAEPYGALDILGEGDFDQIYARREALGGSPELVQGILAVWSGRREAGELDGLHERDALREFLKRLLRLGAFIHFDSLDRVTLRSELDEVLSETLTSLRVVD